MWSTTFLQPFKFLKLQPSKLYVRYNPDLNLILLKTDKFIKNLYISHSEQYIKLSDNYFDMLPNTEKKVTIKKSRLENLESFIEKLKVITLFDSYIN